MAEVEKENGCLLVGTLLVMWIDQLPSGLNRADVSPVCLQILVGVAGFLDAVDHQRSNAQPQLPLLSA
jgi:hypothetical protein